MKVTMQTFWLLARGRSFSWFLTRTTAFWFCLVSLLLGTIEVIHAGLIGLVGVEVGVIHPLGAEQAQQTVVAGAVRSALGSRQRHSP